MVWSFWEEKREKIKNSHYLGSEKRKKITFPIVWEVKRKKINVSRFMGSEKRKSKLIPIVWEVKREIFLPFPGNF